MIAFSNEAKLGYGIYTVSDMAALLGLPVGKVRYWLAKFWDGRLAHQGGERHSWGEKREKAVNFYVLIEFFVFYQLRELGVSVPKILTAHRLLTQKLGTPYPFASNKIMTDGRAILFSPDRGESILDARPTLQHNIPGIILEFVEKIEFDQKGDLAERFFPAGKGSSVVIDPRRQFGQPIILGTAVLAETLFRMHQNGEKKAFIASAYGLRPKQVADAIDFYAKAA